MGRLLHEPTPTDAASFDCRACGVCCREASDGRILVPAEDITRFRREGRHDIANSLVEGHFGEMAFPCRADGACVYLGSPTGANDCSIYPIRGTTCRDFEAGSQQCREFRRYAGIGLPTKPA
jgi:Fe-S-cluster containining protein